MEKSNSGNVSFESIYEYLLKFAEKADNLMIFENYFKRANYWSFFPQILFFFIKSTISNSCKIRKGLRFQKHTESSDAAKNKGTRVEAS